MSRNTIALILLATLLAAPSFATSVLSGQAIVVDGDTLEIHGKRIRLHGVDAPESAQLCRDGSGRDWRCGQRVALALADRIGRQTVTCEQRDVDRYDRIVAVCSAGEIDLNRWLVSNGLAVAYREYSREYLAAEDAAREARIGIWASAFEMPWEWRRRERGPVEVQPASSMPGECQIKGNINSKGNRVYHRPGQRDYERTVIDENKGERWFCSEDEAAAAGWRPARR